MDLMTYLIPLTGGLLCLFALAQLGFWAAQSWRINTQSKAQFELARQLLRQQIEEAAIHRNRPASASPNPGHLQRNLPSKANESTYSPMSPGSVQADTQQVPGTVVLDSDGRWQGYRSFRVTRLVSEAEHCRSVYLEPVDEQPLPSFLGGQHLPLRFTIPGIARPVVRCYSISNGPDQGHFRLSVKAVPSPADRPDLPAGLVSNFINQTLQVGDLIDAKAPSGRFVVDQDSPLPIVMLAGGIGITPMISMLHEAFSNASNRLMILVYGARRKGSQAFKAWLDEQAAKRDNFHVVHCYSAPTESDVRGVDYQVDGYVTLDLLKKLLPKPDCQFYLCGPPAFMRSITDGLAQWGVADSQIFSEAFGPASRSHRIVERATDAVPTLEAKIRFARTGVECQWSPEHECLLNLAEVAGIEIDSGCRSGACGTCATRILKGNVCYDEPEVECEAGQCLTCIAQPLGDLELDA